MNRKVVAIIWHLFWFLSMYGWAIYSFIMVFKTHGHEQILFLGVMFAFFLEGQNALDKAL